MAVFASKDELSDILIVNIKRDATAYANWIETYLLRADKWYIERCEELGVDETDIITYVEGQKGSVEALLRNWVYIEVLTDLKSNGLIDTDDYNSKINGQYGYKSMFDSLILLL